MQWIQSVWSNWCMLAPWLLLGAAIAGAIHVALPREWLQRRFSGVAGVFKAVAFGIPLPLCSCGVIPAGVGLHKSGAGKRPAIAFLISTPQTGVDSILVSATFLGWPLALFKVVVALVTGVAGGLLTQDSDLSSVAGPVRQGSAPTEPPDRPVRIETPSQAKALPNLPVLTGEHEFGATSSSGAASTKADSANSAFAPSESLGQVIRSGYLHALDIIESIWLWLVIGVVTSALLEVLITPTEWFQSLMNAGPVVSMLLVLGLSIPLYVCATASVPIAAALVYGGMPVGSAIVFLVAGPATNLATIGVIGKEFGRRNLVVYLVTIILGSVLGGFAFEWFFDATIQEGQGHSHHGLAWWESAGGMVLTGLLVYSGTRRLMDRFRVGRSVATQTADAARRTTYPVSGMHCQNCVRKIERALVASPAVDSVFVDLERQEVVVGGRIDADTVRSVIESCGYSLTG